MNGGPECHSALDQGQNFIIWALRMEVQTAETLPLPIHPGYAAGRLGKVFS